jgi:hypothetical protein
MSREIDFDSMTDEQHQKIINAAFVQIFKTGNAGLQDRIEFLLHYDRPMSMTKEEDNAIFNKCVELSRQHMKDWGLPYSLTNDQETRRKYCGKVARTVFKQSIVGELEREGYEFPESIKKPFLCEKCPLRFSDIRRVKFHIKEMHAEKNLECLECHKKFTTLGQLNFHLKVVHPKILLSCDKCKKSLNRNRL